MINCLSVTAAEYSLTSTTVVFSAGTTQGHKECISVIFSDDDIIEGLECFAAYASNVARFIPVCALDNKGKCCIIFLLILIIN